MILRGLQVCGKKGEWDIEIRNGLIHSISCVDGQKKETGPAGVSLTGTIVFPGLINSHDHLDFNLFEKLGSSIYSNYVEWADTIHRTFSREIERITRIPQPLRVKWGEYKNLLNGFTTVVHHGPLLKIESPVIDILQSPVSLHSVRLEKNWRWKINRPSTRKRIFAIHVGEGTDEASATEIDELIRGNIFKRDLVGIHAVAMTGGQAENFKAIVWCPASNHFLLGQTAAVDRLAGHTQIVFGTDSTLTADWNAWTQIREARNTGMVSDQQLFEMLTATAASVWDLPQQGVLAAGSAANLVLARRSMDESWNSFYALNPEDLLLVIHRGVIRLYDESIKNQLAAQVVLPDGFGKICFGEHVKFVPKELPDLAREIKRIHPDTILPFSI